VITALLIGSMTTIFLPDKYFFDANLIYSDPYNEKGLLGSYSFSMWFYDILKLNHLPYAVISFIQLSSIFYIIKRIGIPEIFAKPVLRNVIVWSTLLMFSIYLSMPSKEFINFLYISVISYILISKFTIKKKVLIISALLIFFGVWYRPYFALMPFLSFGLYYLSKINIRNRVLNNIIGGLLIACFMSLSYGIVKGEFMTESSREALNQKRIGREDSQTIILSPIKTDNIVGESVGIFYGFLAVNFPLDGFKFFYKPQVVAFVFWQLLMFTYLVYFYNKCTNNRSRYRHEEWIFHFVFAYLIIQGIFEPDLGSAVKHKLGVFPLIYLAFYFDKGLRRKEN
jgi:hypothetical protein